MVRNFVSLVRLTFFFHPDNLCAHDATYGNLRLTVTYVVVVFVILRFGPRSFADPTHLVPLSDLVHKPRRIHGGASVAIAAYYDDCDYPRRRGPNQNETIHVVFGCIGVRK
jgi:hypothetical protein